MPPPDTVDPLRALELLVERLGHAPPQQCAVKDACGGYLSRQVVVELPGPAGAGPLAACNIFAVPAGARPGDLFAVLGVVTPAGAVGAASAAGSGGAVAGCWRVETGGEQPDGFDRAIPIEHATLVAGGRVRLDRVDAGNLWERPPRRLCFPAGTPVGERLRAILDLARVEHVEVVPRAKAALAVLGEGLSPPRSGLTREDVTGPWLAAALAALGEDVTDLGLRPQTAEGVRDAILHCRGRADVLVLAGGLGNGLTDRTIEHLERFEARMTFRGVACAGASRLCHARALGMDVVGLGGRPLETACVFDLFLAPALLARRKAPPGRWDWSGELRPVGGRLPAPGTDGWRAFPARIGPGDAGGLQPVLLPDSQVAATYPLAPGQDGWVVLPPGQRGSTLAGHWQALAPRA